MQRTEGTRIRRTRGDGPRTGTSGAFEVTRTTLYPIQPLGGGVERESLTSYVRRLAQAHAVSPSILLRKLVLEPERTRRGERNRVYEPTRAGESLSGTRAATALTADALAGLTGVTSVRGTTLLGLDDALCVESAAFRRMRAWCPQCLAEQPAYDRLIWTFIDVRTCARHQRPLVDACPRCTKRHRPLHANATPDRCAFCAAQLGDPALAVSPATADQTEEIIRVLVQRFIKGRPVTKKAVSAGVLALLDRSQWADVNSSGIGRASLSTLRRSRTRASLRVFCHLVRLADESVDEFLGHHDARVRARPVPRHRTPAITSTIDLARLEADLRAALVQPRIPSIRAFCAGRGISESSVRKHVPALAAQLRDAHRAQRGASRRKREAEEARLVHDIARRLIREGCYTRRALEAELPRAGMLLAPHCRSAITEALEAWAEEATGVA